MMQALDLVPNSELDFADYHSYYLTWYHGENDDSGPYGEPLLSSQGVYDDSNSEETVDYYSRSLYANGLADQDFRGVGNAEIGSENWFGEYEYYFGDYWGGETYADGQYQDDSSYQEQKDGISSSNNDDIEQDYSEKQWYGYGDFGFEDDGEDFHNQGSPEFEYNGSWDAWEETLLYEQIFGD